MNLGTEGLPAAEAGLLQTILRLSSDLAGRWVMAASGPCDAVLFDDGAPGARQAARARSGVAVPVLQRGAQAPDTPHLQRPVRAEAFLALLRSIEAKAAAPAAIVPPVIRSGIAPVFQSLNPMSAGA